QTHLELRDATDEDLAEIAALESASFGGDRAEMIAQLAGCARIALLGAQGDLRGFAACRAFGRGHVIGPVVAPDAQAGLALIAHLAQPLAGRPLRVDVLAQAGLEPGLAKMGLTSEYRVPVMQRGDQSIGGDRLALLSQGLC
ncbi:MAG: GNAT family N-acetyltransferase, partial [Pseudomonadota bacterium]